MTDDLGSASVPWRAVGWALVLAALTSVGLVALTWFLVTMDVLVAIGMGLVGSLAPEAGPDRVPILDGYGRAVVAGVAVNLVVAVILALLAERTVARSWPAWATGLVSAGVAFLVAGSVLLLALGISPVDFVAGL